MNTYRITTAIVFVTIYSLLLFFNHLFAQDVPPHYVHWLKKDTVIADPDDKYVSYELKNVSEFIGNDKIHSGSRITHCGNKLYLFTEEFSFAENELGVGQEIAVCYKLSDNTWSKPTFVNELNNYDDNGVHFVSKDGQRMLLLSRYLKNGTSMNGVSFSELQLNGKWSFPKPLKIKKYQNDQRCSFYMTYEEDVLLLAIRTDETHGNQDLYVSFKKGKKWTKPQNMGAVLNSEGSEATVFLSEDTKTIYFSSNGRKDSFGGFDIYKSERLDDTWVNWSEPVNLGFPYNSSDDDLYYTHSVNDEYAYLSRHFVDEDSLHQSDIVAIKKMVYEPNPVVALNVDILDFESLNSISADKRFINRESGESLVIAEENAPVMVPCNQHYDLFVSSNGYIGESETVYFECEDYIEQDLKVYLKQKREGVKWTIENVHFVYNEAILLDESYAALEHIYSILKKEADIHVEISGHTDARGSDNYNNDLSQRRANAIVDYFVANGIEKNRLVSKGYGKRFLLNHCKEGVTCDEDLHQVNRRVEFKITSLELQ